MKINDYIAGSQVKTYGDAKVEGQETKTKPQADQGGTPEKGDKVVLSERSKEIARAKELAEGAPEVRTEKVAKLKAAIEAGTYNIKAEKVADAILKGMIDETV